MVGLYLDNCIPNAHNSWDGDAQHETIYAVKNILPGEEIVISYDAGLPSVARWAKLKGAFGFQCRCELCQLPVDELARSDRRREEIGRLDVEVGDPFTMMSDPLESLKACSELLQLINNEYRDSIPSLEARAYYDAFQISAAHSDRVRASVFAERAYNARVICEGEDSPETKKMKVYMQDPCQHPVFGVYSKIWRSRKPTAPKNLDETAFEKWLWRR